MQIHVAKFAKGFDFPALLLTVVTVGAILVAGLHPVGFVGGGQDDARYLAGVECLLRNGFCAPTNHWEARAPFLYPVAAVAKIFGESREALWIVPFLFSVSSIFLLGQCVKEAFGRRAGLFAALTFLLCAEIGNRLLDLSIDIPELAFLLAGTYLLLRRNGLGAGVAFGLAVLCRPTTVALAPFILIYLGAEKQWSLMFKTAVAALTTLVAEVVFIGVATGEPFLTWRLAFQHNLIPSSYLNWQPFVGNPLLNMSLVAAWPPAAHIDAPWLVKPIINFLAFPTLVVLHAATFTALVLAKSRSLTKLALYAAGYFLIVAYGFAIDPKPRMFLPVIAVECAILSAYAVRPDGVARLLAATSLISLTFIAFVTSFDRTDLRSGSAAAASELRRDPYLAVEKDLSNHLEVRGLGNPVFDGTQERFVAYVRTSCVVGRNLLHLPPTTRIESQTPISREEPSWVVYFRRAHMFLQRPTYEHVCIYDL